MERNREKNTNIAKLEFFELVNNNIIYKQIEGSTGLPISPILADIINGILGLSEKIKISFLWLLTYLPTLMVLC